MVGKSELVGRSEGQPASNPFCRESVRTMICRRADPIPGGNRKF
jgi:hypothetical protein